MRSSVQLPSGYGINRGVARRKPATACRRVRKMIFTKDREDHEDYSMRDRTLVTFALRQEGYPFARNLRRRTVKNGLILGLLGTRETAVCWLGIGVENADLFARRVAESQPRLVINSGFAGGVRSLLEPGDFILATNYSSQEVIEKLGTSNLFSARGKLISVKRVASPETKAQLGLDSNVLAIDMESERMTAVCRNMSVPYLTARMISDRSDEAVPKLFIDHKIRAAGDILQAIQFAGRMLVLRERLAARLRRRIDPDQISVFLGSQLAFQQSFNSF
jgi:nucleoside phosphorylase